MKTIRGIWIVWGVFGSIALGSGIVEDPPESEKLSVTKPVLCKEIRGYEDYDARGDQAYTRDEKLVVYFRPLHYKEKAVGAKKEVHFKQEARIHKRGEKRVLAGLKEHVEYKNTFQPPAFVYLHNRISLKDLKPGEYEYDIVLTDVIGGEKLTHTIEFKVVESKAKDDADPKKEPARKDVSASS